MVDQAKVREGPANLTHAPPHTHTYTHARTHIHTRRERERATQDEATGNIRVLALVLATRTLKAAP